MRRHMDLIRALLLKIEGIGEASKEEQAAITFDAEGDREGLEAFTPEQVLYHLHLLCDAGFLRGQELLSSGTRVNQFDVEGITWRGHEFLDDVRDPKIWKLTKEGAKKAGIASVGLVWDLAKGHIKQVAQGMGLPIP